MSDEIDFTEDLKTGDINRVTDKAREMYKLERSIERQEKELSATKEIYKNIQTEELPAIMAEEIAADELPFDNGYKLKLKPVIAGSIPSQSAIRKCKDPEEKDSLVSRRDEAFEWLRDNDAGSLISNTVSVVIPKSGEGEEKAKKLMLLAHGLGLEAYREENVHFMTLNSYLKEQIESEDGKDIPFDIFAVFVGKKAVIEAPKKK